MTFFFWHNCKADTHIFFYVYVNFLPVLHIVNSLKITKTLVYSVLTKIRYKKQNWMQGQHNGKMVDLFNWPKFRLTKSVFFRARAVNRGIHVYPRMSKGYLQPLVLHTLQLNILTLLGLEENKENMEPYFIFKARPNYLAL